MKINKRLILASLAIATALSACKKDTDDEAPVVSNLRINGELADYHELNAGDTFTLTASVTDNEALNQVKVDIHGNADGHTHEFNGAGEVKSNDWTVLDIISVSGSSSSISREYTIPKDQVGEYDVLIQAIDKEGNESNLGITELEVSNSFIPLITVDGTVPAENGEGEIVVSVGSMFMIEGNIMDADGLAEIHAELIVEGSDPEEVLWEEEFDPASATDFNLDQISFSIPDTEETELALIIHATDTNGFEAELELELHVE